MPEMVVIDTNIFVYAYVLPKKEEYVEIHQLASKFLLDALANTEIKILLSSYQLAEILEVLRKVGANKEIRSNFLEVAKGEKFIVRLLSKEMIEEAFELSAESNIHIYDYLVVIPAKDAVMRIYSADDHFFHEHFTAIAPVQNPIVGWSLIEGKRPVKEGEK